ncbi:hypothetical protein PILCRDRAFT_369386 [Piloderma croceum F 1598]|uniref:Uncharacterized protein n=1 Tax=Piloderma croceum (strain F 1598) TaxID=765440 RepID=A0A0C3FYQ9_PILCF|nr:hypothetical protein PILCRDRAFT_369386 [Piloderma croceum F 1598]
MTTLSIKKGSSVDILKPYGPVEFGDDVKTTAQLRTILTDKEVMGESDQFVDKDGSLLKRDVEASTQWPDLVAEDAIRIICSDPVDEIAPAAGDTAAVAENGAATIGDTVPTKGDSVPAAVDAVPAIADTAPATETIHTTVETVQTGNASATDYTATETGGKTKTELQGFVNRTKTEVIETALNKTGAIVQQKFTQGMQEARVAVDKVIAIAGASGAKMAESVATQKARLQGAGVARAGSAIMTFGGIVTGEGDDSKTTPPSISMSPKLTNMFKDAPKDAPKDEPKDASEQNGTPGGANFGKTRSASARVVATSAQPQVKRGSPTGRKPKDQHFASPIPS